MKRLILILCLVALVYKAGAQEISIYSPNGKLVLTVNLDQGIKWSVKYDGKAAILPSSFSIELPQGKIPGDDYRLKDHEITSVVKKARNLVPNKDATMDERYNQLELKFRNNYSILFRAYDDGVAYRLVTNIKGNIIVLNEQSVINFDEKSTGWYPLERSFMSHNERTYLPVSLDTLTNEHLASLPLVVRNNGINILISESALEDYPGMWIRGNGPNSLVSVFPPYPEKETLRRDRDLVVESTMDFIAETNGRRSFPWRMFIISPDDKGLIESNLTYLLADTARIDSTDWIKPGKVAWDWWNANNIYGVDFRAGLNNETYKYYIDFASDHGIEYVILDEGWYELGNLLKVSPGFNIKELCEYAESKNVGIILWVVWVTLNDQLDAALQQFDEWGVKGLKVDFMQRDDQPVVNYYWKIAKKAAEHHMLVDFHGSYKPAGLRRAYPNVLSREGVKGLEHNKWSSDITPQHDCTIPFIRMVAGPMDYTPGAMVNLGTIKFNPMYSRPASQGTRAHQMALYVVFESPLQMMADSPSNYMKEEECTMFIAGVPVTWDETTVLKGKIGEYVIIARRKGEDWYLGGITNSESREFEIDLSFLGTGDYDAEMFEDGINADRFAEDYKSISGTVNASDILKIRMAPGGGWVASLRKR